MPTRNASSSNIFKSKYTISFMHRIVLLRHGQSIWNQDSKFTGWTNIPLTNYGRQEATQMAKTLIQHNIFPTVLFTSVLQRSIETSQLIQREFKEMPIHTSWLLKSITVR